MIYSYIYAFARALQAQIRQKSHVDKMGMDCTYFWQNKTKTGGSTVWLALGCFLQKIENNNESKQREERERERDEGNLSDSNELTATWASQKQSKSKYQTFWTALILHCRWFAVLGPLLKEFWCCPESGWQESGVMSLSPPSHFHVMIHCRFGCLNPL